MRVAFDHQIFALQRYGGVSRYFVEVACRVQSSAAADVTVVAPLHINYYLSQITTARLVTGRYIATPFRGEVRLVNLLNKLAAPVAWRGALPDVVHETYYSKEPIGRGLRRVVTVHDMIYELFPAEFPNSEPFKAAKRAAIERADHVICISNSTRRDLARFYDIEPSRMSVVHHGHSAIGGILEPGPCASRKPSILYVGNRSGYKNFSRLARAFASTPVLREFELLAFGGPPFAADEIAELERLGIRDRVRHRSGSDRDLFASYASATVFVYPSLYEGFGIPALEAMGCGCPIIASDRGSLPEVVGEAGIYADPESVDDMRAAMERVVTSPTLQEDLRAKGRERAKAFSWDACAAATAGIYRAIR